MKSLTPESEEKLAKANSLMAAITDVSTYIESMTRQKEELSDLPNEYIKVKLNHSLDTERIRELLLIGLDVEIQETNNRLDNHIDHLE